MRKKFYFVAILVIATISVSLAQKDNNQLSDIALANIEALSQYEEGTGAASVTLTDLGITGRCIGSVWNECQTYYSECYGSGSIGCTSGKIYKNCIPRGRCAR